jgi:hypothetical protein
VNVRAGWVVNCVLELPSVLVNLEIIMKARFYQKIFMVLAAALAVAGVLNVAQAQPVAAAAESALPANIIPGSPLAEVLKMVQAGVDVPTVESYIANCQSPFSLDADKILYLKDDGVPSELVNAMMERDKALFAASLTPAPAPVPAPEPVPMAAPAPAPAPETMAVASPDMAPPAADVSADYFNTSLSPYGSWVVVEGYGRCWRPTTVIYDSNWSPYGDRGHWVYTDYGWYWDSDYAWGATFHYGRWFRDPRIGWCWYPDTVWAPSWVTWRSDDAYCGWAPLPPFAEYRAGVGFFYRGVSVGVDFDFGLGADCFLFVGPDHFCDRHPRSFCVPRDRVGAVFHQTRSLNHFDVNNRTMVNRGFGSERIANATHRAIEPVHMSSLPNAGRQGWRGEGFQHTMQRAENTPAGRVAGGGNNPSRDNNAGHSTGANGARPASGGNNAHAGQGQSSGGNQAGAGHAPGQGNAAAAGGSHAATPASGTQNRVSSSGATHSQSQGSTVQQPQTHSAGTVNTQNRTTTQGSQSSSQSGVQPGRSSGGVSSAGGAATRGSQQQQQTGGSTFNTQNRATTQGSQGGSQSGVQQSRGYGGATSAGSTIPHGGQQQQQGPSVVHQSGGESPARSSGQTPAQGGSQQHATTGGNGNNNGGGNAGHGPNGK